MLPIAARSLRLGNSEEEKVYVRRVQFRLNDLASVLERHPARGISKDPAEDKARVASEILELIQKAEQARGSIVGTALARFVDRLATPAPSNQTAKKHHNERRAMVNAYIEEVLITTGIRITRKDIWTKAGYKTRTEFERWERGDEKHPNKSANANFRRILAQKPHLK